MSELTFKQKAEAMKSLASLSLKFRNINDWYVSQSVEIKQGSVLAGVSGNGENATEALTDHWNQLTDLNPNEYLVLNAYSSTRRAVKWNGFMWQTVKE